MLYLSSYLNSFRHARISMSITFACEASAAPTGGASAKSADEDEQASLSGGYTEAVEGWILQQLS